MAIDPVGGGMRPVPRPEQGFDPALAGKFAQKLDAAQKTMRVAQALPLPAPAAMPPPAMPNGKPAAPGNFRQDPAYRWGAHLERKIIENLGGPDTAPPEPGEQSRPGTLPPPPPADWSTAFSDRELAGHQRSSTVVPDTNIEGFPGTPLPPPPPLITPIEETRPQIVWTPIPDQRKPEAIGGGFQAPEIDTKLPGFVPPKMPVDMIKLESSSAPDSSASPEARAGAQEILRRASRVEPEITSAPTKLAGETGSSLAGLEYRLKSEQSLAEKLDRISFDANRPVQDGIERINDSIRYTFYLTETACPLPLGTLYRSWNSKGFRKWRSKIPGRRDLNIKASIQAGVPEMASFLRSNSTHRKVLPPNRPVTSFMKSRAP